MSVAVRAERWADLDAAAALLAPHEPETTAMISSIRRGPRRARAWCAVEGHRVLGVVVLQRVCRGRWEAWIWLDDPAAGAALGAVVERSPAWRVTGTAASVEPLLAHLGRAGATVQVPSGALPGPVPPFAAVDPNARLATLADLDDLVTLYEGWPLDLVPTRPRLRRFLREAVEERRVVLLRDDRGAAVGGVRVDHRTGSWAVVSGLTVVPSRRGEGLAFPMVNALVAELEPSGVGLFATLAPTNPMRATGRHRAAIEQTVTGRGESGAEAAWFVQGDEAGATQWVTVPLRAPRRFPGHRRLRRVLERVEGPVRWQDG